MLDRSSLLRYIVDMNKLTKEEKVRVVACLVEGNSLRATVRMTGVHRTTIQKLLVELGAVCSAYQDKVFRNLKLTRLQCDEIWAFIGCKQKNVHTTDQLRKGWGDIWTWTALDAETKLVPCWYIGTRDGGAAYHFINDLKERLANPHPIDHRRAQSVFGSRRRGIWRGDRLRAIAEDLRQRRRPKEQRGNSL